MVHCFSTASPYHCTVKLTTLLIGFHFPSSSDNHEVVHSMKFYQTVIDSKEEKGWRPLHQNVIIKTMFIYHSTVTKNMAHFGKFWLYLTICLVTQLQEIIISAASMSCFRSITSAYWTGTVGLQPFVNTSCMEFMSTRKNPQNLSSFEVTYAHNT